MRLIPAGSSEEARCVAFIDEYHGLVLISKTTNLFQRSDITVHAKYTVRYDEFHTRIFTLL